MGGTVATHQARVCHSWCGDGPRQGLALPGVQLIVVAHQGQCRRGGIVPPEQPGEVPRRLAQGVDTVGRAKEDAVFGMRATVLAAIRHQNLRPRDTGARPRAWPWRRESQAAVLPLDGGMPVPQPRGQVGQPPHRTHIAHRYGASCRLPDAYHQLLTAGDARLQEMACRMVRGGAVPAGAAEENLLSYYKSLCRLASCAHRACDKMYSL